MPAVYVSLGDSMSIDDYAGGPGTGAASLLLRNRDTEFRDWVGRDLTTVRPGVTALLLARDGATTADIATEQLDTLRAMKVRPTHVTLTGGGNDLLSCYGDTPAAVSALSRVWANLAHILGTLRDLSGEAARIVVTTVYDPSDGTGVADGAYGLPPWPDGLELLARLNETIRASAAAYGAAVAEVHARFLGHGVSAGDPAQPDPRPENPHLWYCGVIEPNAFGAHAIRTCWWDAFGFTGSPGSGSPGSGSPGS
jgi:lysophospholipase L1-like esterase